MSAQLDEALVRWRSLAADVRIGTFGSITVLPGGASDLDSTQSPALLEHVLVLEALRPIVPLGSSAHPGDVLLGVETTATFPRDRRLQRNRLEVPDSLDRFAFQEQPRLSSSYFSPRACRFVITQADGQTLFCTAIVLHVPADPRQLVAHAANQMRQGVGRSLQHGGVAAQDRAGATPLGSHYSIPIWLRQALQRGADAGAEGRGARLWRPVAVVCTSRSRQWDLQKMVLADASMTLAVAGTASEQALTPTDSARDASSGRERQSAAAALTLFAACEAMCQLPLAVQMPARGTTWRLRGLFSDIVIGQDRQSAHAGPRDHADSQ